VNPRKRWWSVIGTVVAAAYAVTVLTHAPGVTYAVIAVLAGAAYSVTARLSRSGPDPMTGPQESNPRE
jgi:uncharacterized membrane protein HdeD (DUF308 family)